MKRSPEWQQKRRDSRTSVKSFVSLCISIATNESGRRKTTAITLPQSTLSIAFQSMEKRQEGRQRSQHAGLNLVQEIESYENVERRVSIEKGARFSHLRERRQGTTIFAKKKD